DRCRLPAIPRFGMFVSSSGSVSPNDGEPVFSGVSGRRSDRYGPAALDRSHGPSLEGSAIARIEPAHTELAACPAQIQIRGAAGGEIDEVQLAAPGETVTAVVMVGIAHQRVRILHVPEGDSLQAEEFERDPAEIPGLVPAAKVLQKKIVLRELIAK